MPFSRFTIAAMLMAIVLPGFGAEPGIIRGKVMFSGTPPPAEPMKISGDDVCEQLNKKNPIMRSELVVNPNGTLKNTVIWISKGGPDRLYKSKGKALPPAVLLQQGCTFYPRIVPLQTGQKLEIRNTDPTIQNVNSYPEKNYRFNKSTVPGGEPVILSFDKPEVAIKLKSDIHPWMIAWIPVFDHPGYAVTGDDGTFEITDLPPGEYTLDAWHEKYGMLDISVLVQAEKPTEVVFNFTAHGSKAGMQIDSHGNATTGTVDQ